MNNCCNILNTALLERQKICGTRECIHCFPKVLTSNYFLEKLGIIVCREGAFTFIVNGKRHSVEKGQTVFLSSGKTFCVESWTENLSVAMVFYDTGELREILGDTIIFMRIYSLLAPDHCEIINTAEENDLCHFIFLAARYTICRESEDSAQEKNSHFPICSRYDERERISLLLSLTYRVCSLYSRRQESLEKTLGRKMEIFSKLIELVEKNYSTERGVAFYADKLCLSPKYLTTIVKSVCGYTVQEVVFMAIIRRCIFLMRNTNKTIQQISDEMHFPNISAFGTFFKKQTGLSPRQFKTR